MGFHSDFMGFYGDLVGFFSDVIGFYCDFMGYERDIPSSFVKIAIEHDHCNGGCSHGKW